MKWISDLKTRFENQGQTWKWKTWKWEVEFQVYFKKSNILIVFSTTLNKGKGHWVEVAAELGLAKQGRFFVRLLLFKAKCKGQCIGSREATALFFFSFLVHKFVN